MVNKCQLYYYALNDYPHSLCYRGILLSSKITTLGESLRMEGAPGGRDTCQDGFAPLLAGSRLRFIFSHWLVSGHNWKIQLKHYSFWVFHSLGGKKIPQMIMWLVTGHLSLLELKCAKGKVFPLMAETWGHWLFGIASPFREAILCKYLLHDWMDGSSSHISAPGLRS